jgi:pimeloyl-ACP methyl ester carboxylesterase/DUF971 family protein
MKTNFHPSSRKRNLGLILLFATLVAAAIFPSGSLSKSGGRHSINALPLNSESDSFVATRGTARFPNLVGVDYGHLSTETHGLIHPSVLAPASSPSISSISPNSPTVSSGNQNVTVFGSSFQSGLTVSITFPGGGGTTLSGTQIQSVTSTSFVMVATLSATGTWSIRVNNPDGGQSNTFFFTVQSSSPSISSISPSAPTRSDSDQSVQVFGSNFVSGLTVTVFIPGGGTATLSGSQIQSLTSTSFTMVITLNVVGQYGIRVNNPSGAQSNTFNFSVQQGNPSINSISPSSPTRNDSNQNVSVFGSNFVSGLTVTVFIPGGGTATLSGSQIQSVNSSSFTMVITLNVVGQYGIRVNNPSGAQSNTFNFNVQAANPSISSTSPATPTRSDSDQSVQVFGSNFVSGLTVTVFIPSGGSATLSGSQIQSVTSTSVTMIVTLNVVGQYGIRVNNPSGAQSNIFNFNVQAANPSVASISPSSPTRNDSNQNVSVFGSNFVSGLTVTVFIPGGGTATLSGSQIQSVTSSSFTMVITLNVVGQYGIRVNNPSGAQSNTFNFNVQQGNPSISSVSPATPTRSDSDQSVQVSGSNFVSGLTVTVFIPGGGTATLSGSQIQSVTSSSFTMVITLNVVGQYGIRVNNPSGAQSNTFNFNVQTGSATINSISPATPTRSDSDQSVQVFGSNFGSGLTVTVFIPGGAIATLSGSQIQGVTPSSFTMIITLNVVGQYGIRVNNSGGAQSNTFNFNVQQPRATPAISSISPATPTSNGNDQNVTVLGSNFQQNLTVTATFPGGGSGTLSGTQIQSVNGSSFTMRITLGAPGTWGIRVNNPDGTQSNNFGFSVVNGVQNPSVSSIDPSVVSASATDQDVTVIGNNFQANLSVIVTFPSGGTSTLTGAQIRNVTPTSFIMRITANSAGTWKMRVVNSDGGQGNDFSFSVVNVGGLPTISAINPSSPTMNGADQDVIVNGTNFQDGLRVNVIFPGGGSATLQGTGQIQNVTSNAFKMRITLNASGQWGIRVINADGRQSSVFNFNVQPSGPQPFGLPQSILSPVIGSLRVTSSNLHIADGKWEFDQHKTGSHVPGGGIHASNDTNAWDINLYTPTNSNEDVGQPVYAVDEGDVVTYAGLLPGAASGAVLIAHPNKDNPVWWSGYLHMTNIMVTLNQHATQNTIIGDIGRVGADNDHLHLVVYYGKNARGELISFDVPILERGASSNIPSISSINPEAPIASDDDQEITIIGTDFQPGLSVNLSFPDGVGGVTLIPTSQITTAGKSLEAIGSIESVSATSVKIKTPLRTFGRWALRVINNDGGQSPVHSFTVQPSASARIPLILIPGIGGSRLDAQRSNGSFDNLWPGFAENHFQLSRDPQDGRRTTDPIVARDVLRTVSLFDVYQPLITMLTDGSKGGYVEYKPSQACSPTLSPKPSLFLFPYDWREGNDENIADLRSLVKCINNIYQANVQVDVLAHSMGGLVARRYITSTPNHQVRRLITVGTPWLGAPKALYILETGQFLKWYQKIAFDSTIKELSWFFTGVHELTPSRAYFDLGGRPYGEKQWDINGDHRNNDSYSFDELSALLNSQYPDSSPGRSKIGSNGNFFHSLAGQDNWRDDSSGVEYYHFYGVKKSNDTITKVVPTITPNCTASGQCAPLRIFDTSLGAGDGTVPILSATRLGDGNFNAPEGHYSLVQFTEPNSGGSVEHGDLTKNATVQKTIRCVFVAASRQAATNCFTSFQSANLVASANPSEPLVQNASYYVKVNGAPYVLVTDSFGNTKQPLNDSSDEDPDGVSAFRSGDRSMVGVFPIDSVFQILIKSDGNPFSINLTKGTGDLVTDATRYIDVALPANTSALLRLDPITGVSLQYDSNSDGLFETDVPPTFKVSGSQAADLDPPSVAFSEVAQANSQISISATDAGSGVKSIFYSVDGKNYQPYATALTLNPAQTPIVYAFADDNVGNRSGVSTFQLSPAITLQLASSSFAANEGDGIATITVNRTGNSSGPATVAYSTSDGTASQKKDYILASGTLTLAAGETSKTFTILLINNSYVDGDRTVNIGLTSPTGASLGLVGTATLTIHDNDTALSTNNPVDDAGFLVQQNYLDFLTRQPDQSGLDFWTNQITSCGTDAQCIEVHRINVSASFFLSIEFQQTGYMVERFYKVAYGNANGNSTFGGAHQLPVPIVRFDEFLRDSQRIGRGVVVLAPGWEQLLESNKQAYANEFVQSSRFVAAFPTTMTAADFVDKLNQNSGNVLSTSERTIAINLFGGAANSSNATARAQAVRQVAEDNDLYNAEFSRAFVLAEYYGYLRRNPNDAPESTLDYTGYDFWLSKLNQFNGNYINAEMVKAFLSSIEYRQRFAP